MLVSLSTDDTRSLVFGGVGEAVNVQVMAEHGWALGYEVTFLVRPYQGYLLTRALSNLGIDDLLGPSCSGWKNSIDISTISRAMTDNVPETGATNTVMAHYARMLHRRWLSVIRRSP